MKTTEYTFQGTTYHLCMNGSALCDIYEKFGSKGFVTDIIRGTGKKSFDATCWMLAKLAEQGELVRRYEGHTAQKIPSESMFRLLWKPLDVVEAKKAIEAAVADGFSREEEPENKEIDLGLLELEKKTVTA